MNSQCNTQVSQKHPELSSVDFVHSNVNSFHKGATLYIFEDNDAVIKMIIEGRSPTLRHVSRSHSVALDWLFDRTNLDSKIQIMTNGHYTRDEWSHLLCLFNISLFSSQSCSGAMAKRPQEGDYEERVVAKSKPIRNLVSIIRTGSSTVPSSTASSSPRNFVPKDHEVRFKEKHGETRGTKQTNKPHEK